MVSFLIHRYAAGPREVLRKIAGEEPPIEYPDVGVYQLEVRQRIVDSTDDLSAPDQHTGTVGLLLMRSYALAVTPVTTMRSSKRWRREASRLYPPSLPDWMHVLRLGVSL